MRARAASWSSAWRSKSPLVAGSPFHRASTFSANASCLAAASTVRTTALARSISSSGTPPTRVAGAEEAEDRASARLGSGAQGAGGLGGDAAQGRDQRVRRGGGVGVFGVLAGGGQERGEVAGRGAAGGDGHVHGDAPRGQGVDEGRGVEEAAAEDGDLFAGDALALGKLDDAVGDPLPLLPRARRHLVQDGAEIAYGCHGLRLSCGAALVAGDRLLGERDDVRGGAVVGPELYLAGAGEAFAELPDVLDPGPAEAVDALRVVPDAEDVRPLPGHEPAAGAPSGCGSCPGTRRRGRGRRGRRSPPPPGRPGLSSLSAYCTTPS